MIRPPVRWFVALLLSLCLPRANAAVATLVGHIVSISDGDTVILSVERQPIKKRWRKSSA